MLTHWHEYFFAQTGESLIDASHYASDEIEANVDRVLVRWDDLRQALEARGRGLEEALSLVQFKRQVDEVHAMISDRVSECVQVKPIVIRTVSTYSLE